MGKRREEGGVIPKIIHYCWLSGGPYPNDYKRYMATWQEKLTGYEFVLWDTKRFDIESTLWTKQAFELELYACAADYIRFYAVHNYGGIYLDIDMEVIKPFDPLLGGGLFLAYENTISKNIEAGCFGAEKGSSYIKSCMDYLGKRPLCGQKQFTRARQLKKDARHDYIGPPIAPELMAKMLKETDAAPEIYSCDYFTAKSIVTGVIEKTENTYCVHNFSAKYHSERWRELRDIKQRVNNFFAGNKILAKSLTCIIGAAAKFYEDGFTAAIRYAAEKIILRRHKKHLEK